MTPQELDDLIVLIDQYAATIEDVVTSAQEQAQAAYQGVNMYDPEEIAAAAAAAVLVSNAATNAVAGLAGRFLQFAGALMGVSLPTPLSAVRIPPIRNGVDLNTVYARPAKRFRVAVSTQDIADALAEAEALLALTIDTDIRLAQREAMAGMLEAAPSIKWYRRVIRPELSKTGTCGLCIAASDVIYSTGTLLPIHDRCKCIVLPIAEAEARTPSVVNQITLAELYEAAGSTAGRELKKIRYVVQEHGELGPILVQAGHHFTGPEDILQVA